MSGKASLYDRDFYAWSHQQAELLRAGKLGQIDLEHIAEEIESMGKTEKRELVSRLTVLLLHLLKWRFQPEGRGNSWRLSIANSRDEIADLLDDNLSLKSRLGEVVASAYRYARRKAAIETGLAEEALPVTSPWSFEQATDGGFWPGEASAETGR
jgi:hypothetical protein